MPKINIRKYNKGEGDELIRCPHCKRNYLYFVKFHFEKRPKKIDGNLVIPLELIETKIYDSTVPPLCDKCSTIAKCNDCTILLCNWRKHTHGWESLEDSLLCESCSNWKGKRELSTV